MSDARNWLRGAAAAILVAGAARAEMTVMAAPAPAGDEAAAADYRAAYKLVLDESWPAAAAAFRELVARHPASDWVDDAEFWLCYAQEQQGQKAEAAFGCYFELVGRRPKSEWADDARRSALRLAGQLAREGRPEYRERVKAWGVEEDPEELLVLLTALGEIGDERAVAAIIARFDGAQDEELRARIAEILEHTESPAALRKLLDVARRDPSPRVRAAALEALDAEAVPEVLGLLRELAAAPGQPQLLRREAIEQLGELASDAQVPLLRDLALRDPDPEVAIEALEALAETPGDAALAALSGVVRQGGSARLRKAALYAIAEREDEAALDLLRSLALASQDADLAAHAVGAIGEFESPAALVALREVLAAAADWRVKAAAVAALGELETPAAARELEAFVRRERDARLRAAAVDALGEIEHDASVAILLALAKGDPDANLRARATRALGEIGSPAAREALIQLLQQRQED